MKNLIKISVLFVTLFFGVSVNAQDGVSFGAKAGLNLSNFGGDVDDADPKIGFSLGVTLDYGFTDNLYLLTGLDFTTKGCKENYKENSVKYKLTATPLYLQIPVHVGYKLNFTDNSRLVISAGPYIACGVGGKFKADVDGTTIKTDFFGSEEDGGFKRFDFGIGLAVGYEFNKYKVGIGYDFGLVNISHDDDKVKTQNAFLTVGYRF